MSEGHVSSVSRAVRAWCFYDWANSAFATTIVAAILPAYFGELAARSMPRNIATAWWGYASAIAMLLSAVLGALLGTASDRLGRRKPIMAALVGLGTLATLGMAAAAGDWRALLVLFGIAFMCFASANVLYDSLLPLVAAPGEMHRVSARGFAWGYLGGGLLLAVNLAWIAAPHRFGLADAGAAVRLSFASVALWWAGFSLPLFRHVREPGPGVAAEPLHHLLGPVARRIATTLAGARRQPDLFRFLLAYWLYSDGIGTVIRMATIYGTELGIDRNDLIGALLMVQIVAVPASIAFGRIAHRVGPRPAIYAGLAGYTAMTVLAYHMHATWHFWALAGMVALVQGGTQAVSRSLFAGLVPRSQLGEMFGFYSVSEKIAGIIGPLLFGLVAQVTGAGRFAVFTLLPFFIGGALLLASVNLERGRRAAESLTEPTPGSSSAPS